MPATRSTTTRATVAIPAPNMQVCQFRIIGEAPLVMHRFSAKTKQEMKMKMETGKPASSRTRREAKQTDDLFQEARFVAPDGWDGCHAGSFRNALISACRLVGFKMTLAKLSIFIVADGWDAAEPQIPLVRIEQAVSPRDTRTRTYAPGEDRWAWAIARKQEDMARVETGQPYVTVRAAYDDWAILLTIRYDGDQFTLGDIANLLSRVGQQVGIGEGRPDSKNSAGMGWGLFTVEGQQVIDAAPRPADAERTEGVA